MSIPFDFDPMGVPCTGESPITYTDNNIDFDNYPAPGKGKMPMPYLLNYELNLRQSFVREGTIQWTHIITVADVENTDTYIGALVTTTGKPDNPTRKDFVCLTDAPVGEIASKKMVAMRLNKYNKQVPCAAWGPGWTGWMDSSRPGMTKTCATSEWRSNGINEDGEETFTWVRAIHPNYINPIGIPYKTEDVTDCPYGIHAYLRASMYPVNPPPVGFKYTFNPNCTV